MAKARAVFMAALFFISATSAEAAAAKDEWYISGGADHFTDGLNGGDINVGWQIDRHYAIETGLTVGAMTITDDYGYSVAAALAEFTFDGYGFLLLGRRSQVSLFGTVGVASVGLAVSDGYETISARGAAARVGGGIDWRFSRDMSLRVTGRYQSISLEGGYLGSDATVSAQLAYFF